jgi:putative MATE family efflux protein
MGVDGAALASSLSGIPALAVYFPFFFRRKIRALLVESAYRFDFSIFKSFAKIGLPSGVDGVLMHCSFLLFMKIAGLVSITALASTNIIITIIAISFMPGLSFGVTATTIFGQSMGRRKQILASLAVFRSAKFAAIIMSIMGILFIIFGNEILFIFTNDPKIIAATYPCLVIAALAQPADAYQMVFSSALRGAGHTLWVLIVYSIISYGIMLPLAYYLAIMTSFSSIGLWLAFTVWLYLLAISFIWKFSRNEWKGIVI